MSDSKYQRVGLIDTASIVRKPSFLFDKVVKSIAGLMRDIMTISRTRLRIRVDDERGTLYTGKSQ